MGGEGGGIPKNREGVGYPKDREKNKVLGIEFSKVDIIVKPILGSSTFSKGPLGQKQL